jgi:hypothetical protein
MQKYIVIKADEGNSDFVIEVNPITDDEIESIRPVIMALFERRETLHENLSQNWRKWRYNWVTNIDLIIKSSDDITFMRPLSYVEQDIFGEASMNTFSPFVPYGVKGVHTIVSVDIFTLDEKLF